MCARMPIIDHAIENLVDGAFFNSGQCCCGIERIYVHEKHYDRFVEGAVDLVNTYVLGNPLDEATTLGPMAHKRFADLVRQQNAEAVAKGAKAHIDAKRFAADTGNTAYLAPQVLTDVDHSMSVMRDESFGPTVGIMKVTGDEEAIRLMNDSPYGLSAAIWTSDVDAAEAIGEKLETGTVFMNRCDYLDPALAWTGVKDTGRGASLSRLGLRVAHPSEILPPPSDLIENIMTTSPRSNWNYPTAVRFGAGRIAELAEACKSVGMQAPLIVTDPFLATQADDEGGARSAHRRRPQGRDLLRHQAEPGRDQCLQGSRSLEGRQA